MYAVNSCCRSCYHAFAALGDKATVQFQDNVEHVVLLKDIRSQKVCTANKHVMVILHFPVET